MLLYLVGSFWSSTATKAMIFALGSWRAAVWSQVARVWWAVRLVLWGGLSIRAVKGLRGMVVVRRGRR